MEIIPEEMTPKAYQLNPELMTLAEVRETPHQIVSQFEEEC